MYIILQQTTIIFLAYAFNGNIIYIFICQISFNPMENLKTYFGYGKKMTTFIYINTVNL